MRFIIAAVMLISIPFNLGSCTTIPVRPDVVVVPGDREIIPVPGKPGWFEVSAGFLKNVHDQNRILVEQLEICKGSRQ